MPEAPLSILSAATSAQQQVHTIETTAIEQVNAVPQPCYMLCYNATASSVCQRLLLAPAELARDWWLKRDAAGCLGCQVGDSRGITSNSLAVYEVCRTAHGSNNTSIRLRPLRLCIATHNTTQALANML
jgi:hypothetical protein